MRIGIPLEAKQDERRVALLPKHVAKLVASGHQVCVPKGLGGFIGLSHSGYADVGAKVVDSNAQVYAQSDFICKVKEPVEEDLEHIDQGHTLFCYLHLASNPRLIEQLLLKKCRCYAFEMVEGKEGAWPLLQPMSQVAGALAADVGLQFLRAPYGTRALVSGFSEAQVNAMVIGAGHVGLTAARRLEALGVCLWLYDVHAKALSRAKSLLGPGAMVALMPEPSLLQQQLEESDLVIGASLVPGLQTPKVINADMLDTMREGSVLVDVAIDQGGCFATSRPTTHSDPVYVEKGVIHYAVTNMPSAAARTASELLAAQIMRVMPGFYGPGAFADSKTLYRYGLSKACMLQDGKLVFSALKNYL